MIRLRQEENAGTAEIVLTTPQSRVRWLADYVVLGTISILIVLASAAAVATAGGFAVGADSGFVSDSVASAVAQIPAALVYVGVLALAFVLFPRITIPLGWTLLGVGVVLGSFGGIIGLPEWARNISPFTHTPAVLEEPVDWSGGTWMLAGSIVAVGIALVAMRQRELESA